VVNPRCRAKALRPSYLSTGLPIAAENSPSHHHAEIGDGRLRRFEIDAKSMRNPLDIRRNR
jgi:hypothetical protein